MILGINPSGGWRRLHLCLACLLYWHHKHGSHMREDYPSMTQHHILATPIWGLQPAVPEFASTVFAVEANSGKMARNTSK